MNRRLFLQSGLAALATGYLPFSQIRPFNIIFIMADDLGPTDLGYCGNPAILTPNLDRLAAEGVRFTQAYAPSPCCAPTRWSILTGQHTGHAHFMWNNSILLNEPTIAERVRATGYTTALIGKYGINNDIEPPFRWPNQAGFDFFFGFRTHHEAANSYPTYIWLNDDMIPLPENENEQRVIYASDLMINRAVEFISNAAEPFFLHLVLTTPHNNNIHRNYEPPPVEMYVGEDWPQIEKDYASIVSYMDGQIGLIRQALENRGIVDNTLVIFTSDNGPTSGVGRDLDFFIPFPFRAEKYTVYEGGIRVPMLAWGAGLEPGVNDNPAWLVNLGQVLQTGNVDTFNDDKMYWGLSVNGDISEAVRIGNIKVIRFDLSRLEVYDLANDPGETTDLTGQYPDLEAQAVMIMNRYCVQPKRCIHLPIVEK